MPLTIIRVLLYLIYSPQSEDEKPQVQTDECILNEKPTMSVPVRNVTAYANLSNLDR